MDRKTALKNTVLSLLLMGGLTALLVLVFRDHMDAIWAGLSKLSWVGFLLLFCAGLLYYVIDSAIFLRLARDALPDMTFRQAFEMNMLGLFGTVSTCSAGTVPLQLFYLKKQGGDSGRGLGIITLKYVILKGSLLLFTTIFLCLEGRWALSAAPWVIGLMLAGYGICAGVVFVLLLLSSSGRAYRLAMKLCGCLPGTEKWKRRKEKLVTQLNCLFQETNRMLHRKHELVLAVLLDLLKQLCLCAIPWLCMSMLGIEGLSLSRSLMLMGLMRLIAGALPNLAGMGPTEVAFMLLFSCVLSGAESSTLLILYRISTYYLPFVVSVGFFWSIQKNVFHFSEEHPETFREMDRMNCGERSE